MAAWSRSDTCSRDIVCWRLFGTVVGDENISWVGVEVFGISNPVATFDKNDRAACSRSEFLCDIWGFVSQTF